MRRWSVFVAWLLAGVGCLRAEVSLFLSDCVAERGDTTVIGLYISDAATVTAFQTEILFPTGVRLLDARLSPGETNHSLMAKELAEDRVMVGCWSSSNATFTSTSGRIATFTLLCPVGMLGGTYSVVTSSTWVVYPNGGKRALPSTSAIARVGELFGEDGRAQLFTEYPTAQAFCLQNVSSSRWLHLDAVNSKAIIDDMCDDADAQLFMEPAFDAGEACYYLRSAAGYYLNPLLSGSLVRIGLTRTPSAAAAVRFVLTGERTYSIRHAKGGQPMGTTSTSAGAGITMHTNASSTVWKLLPAEATWTGEALEHMATTASSCVGFTKGKDDFALRMAVHHALRAAKEHADISTLSALTENLKDAVGDALAAYLSGDVTVVDVPWGMAETVPAVDYVVSVDDGEGGMRFLTWGEGGPVLTDVLSICNVPIQDIFFNPYTDRYALRISGSGGDGEGAYLACNNIDGFLAEAPRSEGEMLRVWRVQTLTEAMKGLPNKSGSCGPKAKWRFDPDTRTLFITGSERTAFYASADNTPWKIYRHLILRVVIAGDFQSIGSYLLAGCTSLTRLTVTARTAPVRGTNAFEGVPEGLEICALYPDAYVDYVPECKVRGIATLKDIYIYNGLPQKLMAECDFEYTVTVAAMQTLVGTYSTTVTLHIYIEGTGYTLSLPFNYTIEPAPLIATTRAYSRNYGSTNPHITVIYEGLVGKDEEKDVLSEYAVASCEAGKQSPVGDYPITVSGGVLKNVNYTLVFQPSVLTVKPVRLTVRVQDATRMQGEPNPTFSCTYSGFVNEEDEAVISVHPTITTDADEYSAPGLYDIVASGGDAPNYDLRYVTGILTITPGTDVRLMPADDVPCIVYGLQGRPVGSVRESLPTGIYIIKRKKIRIP